MNADLQAELVAHLTEWLREHGALQENQTVEVSLKFLPTASVVVKIVKTKNNVISLEGFIVKCVPLRSQTRIRNFFCNFEIDTLEKLKNMNWEARDVWKARNVGKKSLRDLLSALNENDMSNCGLAVALNLYFSPERFSGREEAELSIVQGLTEQDWQKMHGSLATPTRSSTSFQLHVLECLQKNKNVSLFAKKVFPNSLHRSARRWIIAEMNNRWRRSGLPYRVRFILDPASLNKDRFNGKVQIGLYQKEEKPQAS